MVVCGVASCLGVSGVANVKIVFDLPLVVGDGTDVDVCAFGDVELSCDARCDVYLSVAMKDDVGTRGAVSEEATNGDDAGVGFRSRWFHLVGV